MIDIKKIYIIVGDLKQRFKGIAGQYCKQQHEIEDAVQILMLYFLQCNPETLKDIYKKDGEDGLIKYGAVAIRRMFTSPRSEYYYTYKKYYKLHSTKDEEELIKMTDLKYETSNNTWVYFELIDKELDQLYWYDREIYKLYYNVENKETLDTLAKKTGISRNSLFTTIDNVRKTLKEKLTDE